MPRSLALARSVATARIAVSNVKPTPWGLVDRNEQPDGDYGALNNVPGWLCNCSWKQLQPDSQGQGLQGSKTNIGTLTTALVKNRFNPALKQFQVSGGVSTANVPSNMLLGTSILADGYNVIQLDDGAGHTQVFQLANNINNGDVQIKVSDSMPNFSFPANTTTIYYLTGTAWIDAAVAWANVNPSFRWVDLVIFTGIFAPKWAKQLQPSTGNVFLTDGVTNALPRYEQDSATAGTAGITGPMWDENYRVAVANLFTQLGSRYDPQYVVRAVRCSGGGTIFMEPCLRHISKAGAAGSQNAEVVSHMQVAGYTQAADITMLGNYMNNIRAEFPTTPVAHSFNAFNTVTRSFGPFAVTSYTGSPTVTAINLTGTNLPTTGWSSANSCVLLYYYHGRISWTVANPNGNSSFTVDAPGINSAALIAAAALTGTLFCRIAGVDYTISSITPSTGVIALTTSIADTATVDGNLQGMPFWILDRTGLTSYAVTACTTTSITISAGPNPAPQAGAFVTLHQTNNADEATTVTLMSTYRSTLGARAIIGNNSVAADNAPPIGNPGGTQPYSDIVLQGAPYYYQTQADGSVAGALLGILPPGPTATSNCIELGGRWIELPKSYLMVQDFSVASSGLTTAAGSAGSNTLTITGTTNWGNSNRWSGGPGSYGYVVFANGRIYYINASNATTLTCFALQVYDAASQAKTTLSAPVSGTVTSIALSAALGIATATNALIALQDSATGNTQIFTISAGQLSSAISQPVTSLAANATYPTATTTVFYCPLAAAEQAGSLTPVVFHWNANLPAQALALTNRCWSSPLSSTGASGRYQGSARTPAV